MGVVTGDKGRGRDGEELAAFEPGAEVHAKVTVIAEGTPGPPGRRRAHHFDLDRDSTQSWELGVKEVWRGPEAARPRSSTRSAGRCASAPSTASTAARGSTRWARTRSRSATWSASTTPTPPSRRTTCCSSSRPTRSSASILDGGKRLAWGAKTIPGGGLYGPAEPPARAGRRARGRQRRLRGHDGAQGRPPTRSSSGILAAEPIYEALKAGKATTPAGLWGYTKAHPRLARSGRSCGRCATSAPPSRRASSTAAWSTRMATGLGGPRCRASGSASRPTRRSRSSSAHRAASYPKPDGAVHLRQALERLRQRQPDARRPAEPHPRAAPRCRASWPRPGCSMCPAKVYEIDEDAPQQRHRHRAASTPPTASSAGRSPPRAAA